MQYGIPDCLSHIPNPLENVPSAPITIGMTWTDRQFQIRLISYFKLSILSLSLLTILVNSSVEWAGNINHNAQLLFLI